VAIFRHFDRDVRILFLLLVVSKWLLTGTFNAIVSYAERETRPEGVTKRRYRTCLPFVPIHLLFITIIALNFVPEIGFHCREYTNFPLIALLTELGFLATVVPIWALHCKNWCIKWDDSELDDSQKLVLAIFR